jgi:8-oxo-dGTP diphosphatase
VAQDERDVTSPIVVTAAVIERDGRFLVARRQEGVHLAGLWEFPGGKCAACESLVDCLRRELREELDVDAHVGEEILATTHVYPERIVELHFLRCDMLGTPRPLIGQELRWVARKELGAFEFPPADAEVIAMLQALG